MKLQEVKKLWKDPLEKQILKYIRKHKNEVFTGSELSRRLGRSQGHVSLTARKLVKEGKIESLKLSRWVLYGLPETIKRARKKLRG